MFSTSLSVHVRARGPYTCVCFQAWTGTSAWAPRVLKGASARTRSSASPASVPTPTSAATTASVSGGSAGVLCAGGMSGAGRFTGAQAAEFQWNPEETGSVELTEVSCLCLLSLSSVSAWLCLFCPALSPCLSLFLTLYCCCFCLFCLLSLSLSLSLSCLSLRHTQRILLSNSLLFYLLYLSHSLSHSVVSLSFSLSETGALSLFQCTCTAARTRLTLSRS